MSLLDSLNNFDAKKDSVNSNSNQGLPAGDYTAFIESIGHHTYESGFECFLVVFQVVTGEFAGQKEYDNISLATKTKTGKAMPEFVLDTAVKTLAKLTYCADIDQKELEPALVLENETDQYEALDKIFKNAQGTQLKLTVKKTKNKKNPDNPYTNYEFEKMEQPKEIEVDENDLPF